MSDATHRIHTHLCRRISFIWIGGLCCSSVNATRRSLQWSLFQGVVYEYMYACVFNWCCATNRERERERTRAAEPMLSDCDESRELKQQIAARLKLQGVRHHCCCRCCRCWCGCYCCCCCWWWCVSLLLLLPSVTFALVIACLYLFCLATDLPACLPVCLSSYVCVCVSERAINCMCMCRYVFVPWVSVFVLL